MNPDSVGSASADDALLEEIERALLGLRLTPGCEARREAAIIVNREAPAWLAELVSRVRRTAQERDTLREKIATIGMFAETAGQHFIASKCKDALKLGGSGA